MTVFVTNTLKINKKIKKKKLNTKYEVAKHQICITRVEKLKCTYFIFMNSKTFSNRILIGFHIIFLSYIFVVYIQEYVFPFLRIPFSRPISCADGVLMKKTPSANKQHWWWFIRVGLKKSIILYTSVEIIYYNALSV